MMDHHHRRAVSDMAYTKTAANRRSGPMPRSYFAVNLEVAEKRFDNMAAKSGGNNTSSHSRSLSCVGTYTWESNATSQTPVSKTPTRYRYSGFVTPEDFPQPQPNNSLLTSCSGCRRSSESSTNSTTSTCTTVADGASTWSAAATPETMSPTSPNSMILLQSPPQRTLSKVGVVVTEPASMPTPTRPSRARAASHSAPKGFHNTPIESPVPEEAEAFLTLRSSRMHRSRPSQEANSTTQATVHTAEDIDISSLHHRRQQRQQNMAGKPHVRQPVRLRLTPLPTPPADAQLGRTPSLRMPASTSPRLLKTIRSMPQIRDNAGPPPAGPLPPIPTLPMVAPSVPCSMPPTPMSCTPFDVHPPRPSAPPPTPSHSPTPSTTSSARTFTTSAPHAQMPTQQQQQAQAQADKSTSWEEELRRHKKLLEQFPPPGEQMNDAAAPKLTRNHRSLGNLRARSRSFSRAAASRGSTSSRDDSIAGESWMAQTYASLSLRGPKSQHRPSTSKSNKDFRMLDQPLPPLPSTPLEHKPSISVFEDDSEDEGGDAVRKFVRHLFARRMRSHADMHAAKESREPHGREGKSSVSSVSSKASSAHSHNDRKKNHSASSNLSVASTVGANNCTRTTNSSTPTTPKVPSVEFCEPLEYHHHHKNNSMTLLHSSTAQVAPAAAPQKAPMAPLLTRMFVRRSN